jgi:acylphosphatase
MASARFIVSGKVQGVFFRASTRMRAEQLGLDGYAKNLATGEVEVVAHGTESALAALETWLASGPPAARVAAVVRHAAESSGACGFKVL